MESSLSKITVAHEEVFYENFNTQFRFQILSIGVKAEKYANITRFYKTSPLGVWAPTKKQISLPLAAWAELEKKFGSFSATVQSFCETDDAESSNKENQSPSIRATNQVMNLGCYGI